jgi:hypothetical protein
MEGHSSRLKQAEKRMSELEDEMEIKGKTEELLFNKIIIENFPNLEKTMPIQVQEASRTPNSFN